MGRQVLRELATPDANHGSGPSDATVATGEEPNVDESISRLRSVIAALPPDAMQALFRIPHAVTRPLHGSDCLAEIDSLQELVLARRALPYIRV